MITAISGHRPASLPGKVSRFELALPQSTLPGLFYGPVCSSAMGGSTVLLGAVGVIAGAGHLTVARWLAGRDPQGARGANAFLFAGVVLTTSAQSRFYWLLTSAFFMLRVIVHDILDGALAPSDVNNVLHSSQSVIINLSAIVLMSIAQEPQQGAAQHGNPGDGNRRRQCFPVRPPPARNAACDQCSVVRFGYGGGIGNSGRWQRLPSSRQDNNHS